MEKICIALVSIFFLASLTPARADESQITPTKDEVTRIEAAAREGDANAQSRLGYGSFHFLKVLNREYNPALHHEVAVILTAFIGEYKIAF